MRIVVLVKDVPESGGDRKLDLETGLVTRDATDRVPDEIDERALETALSFRESTEVEVEIVALSMGPSEVSGSIRKALAMGADRAVHVVDDELVGADIGLTAEVLAAAIRGIGFDLVVAGNLTSDGSGGVVPAMLAEHLNIRAATSLSSLRIETDRVSGTRATENESISVSAQLPAIVSITEALPEPRFPNFKGIMAAKKKPLETVSVSELGVEVLGGTARTILVNALQAPPRAGGMKVVDDGDGGTRIADFLASAKLI